MTLKQIAKKNMYNKLLIFFAVAANASIWAVFTRLKDEIANFVSLNGNLNTAADAQATTTTGITGTKDALRAKMAETIMKKAPKARVWALDNNTDLEPVFNVHEDDFVKGAEERALSKADDLYTALNDNIGSMSSVNLTTTDADEVRDDIKNFRDSLGKPGAAEGNKETGTKTLVELFDKADHSLEIIGDLLIAEYSETNPLMVEAFIQNRQQVTVGVHHTRVTAHITYANGGGNAENILMHVVEPNKKAISDIDGIAESPSMKPGTYHIQFSGANVTTQTIIAKVKRGETLHLDVQVQAGAGGTGTIKGNVKSLTLGTPPATVTVQGTALTASTDPTGDYTINNVPAGSQTVQAYFNSNPANILSQNTTVSSGGNVVVNFSFP